MWKFREIWLGRVEIYMVLLLAYIPWPPISVFIGVTPSLFVDLKGNWVDARNRISINLQSQYNNYLPHLLCVCACMCVCMCVCPTPEFYDAFSVYGWAVFYEMATTWILEADHCFGGHRAGHFLLLRLFSPPEVKAGPRAIFRVTARGKILVTLPTIGPRFLNLLKTKERK
jgi:hypothetical protein